jgi:hypothetical protein
MVIVIAYSNLGGIGMTGLLQPEVKELASSELGAWEVFAHRPFANPCNVAVGAN